MAKKSHKAAIIGLGLAAATIGSLFLYGKEGAKNRKKAHAWMLKAKGEVLDKIEKAKNLDKATYYKAVDEVEKRYKKLRAVGNKELSALARELKGHWREIERQAARKGARSRISAKRAALGKKRPIIKRKGKK